MEAPPCSDLPTTGSNNGVPSMTHQSYQRRSDSSGNDTESLASDSDPEPGPSSPLVEDIESATVAQRKRLSEVQKALERFNKKGESHNDRWGILRDDLKRCWQDADPMEQLEMIRE